MDRPEPTGGMRHVALTVRDLEGCERFYVDLLGMRVEWRPDPDNVYLTGGNDNLALHREPREGQRDQLQRLDHIGFVLDTPAMVDRWHDYLAANDIKIVKAPRTHRDGARSFYCQDPDGTLVQMIYHPPLAERR